MILSPMFSCAYKCRSQCDVDYTQDQYLGQSWERSQIDTFSATIGLFWLHTEIIGPDSPTWHQFSWIYYYSDIN